MRPIPLLLAVALGVPAARAQAWPVLWAKPTALHSQAAINDPRSHGAIGDRFLSLAEAILLTNKELDENALSAEEVAQLSGFGGDIAWADINAAVVPTITLERELPIIRDTPHGFTLNGSNGTPVIDLSDTRGIVARSDFVDFSNLRLRGGEHGIHLTQDDTLFGTLIDRVDFEGQDVAGLRLTFRTGGGNSRVQVSSCQFRNLRTAIAVDDSGDARTGQLEIFGDSRVEACDVGVDLGLGTNGSCSLYVNGLVATGCGDAFRILSSGGGTPRRDLVFEARYAVLAGSRSALTIEGDAAAQTRLLLQALDVASPGDALSIGPLGAHVDLVFQDSRIAGPSALLGGTTAKVQIDNLVARGSTLAIGSTGAPVTVTDSVLDAVATTSRGTSSVAFRGSLALGGSLTGTAAAPIAFDDGHTAGTTIGPHVTVSRPLPAPHLGTFDAAPLEPSIGSTLTLSASLPTGLDGLIVFGRTLEFGSTLPSGLRLYADGSNLNLVPTTLRGNSQLGVPIPNAPALAGLDLFFHLAVIPQPGTVAPPLALPPGRRVRIR